MIEETGYVVAIDGEHVWLQTNPRSACSHCSVGSDCGTSVLAQWFGKRNRRIRVPNELGLVVGQQAIIGISDNVLMKASLIAYLMPLLSMIGIALLAASYDLDDGAVAVSSIVGLAIGILLMRHWGGGGRQGAYQVKLLRLVPVVGDTQSIEFN